LLGGPLHMELTMASTTQLMNLKGEWCEELFRLVGWPVPDVQPILPGRVAATLAPSTPIHVAKQALPGTPPARYVPSVERAEKLLGLHELIGLEESIRRTASWYSA